MEMWSTRTFASGGSAGYVGRVGALAVALGIGAAVVALPGMAVADTEGSGGAAGSVAAAEPAAGPTRASAAGNATRGSAEGSSRAARTVRPGADSAAIAGGPTARRAAAVRPSGIPVADENASAAGGQGTSSASAAAAVRVAGSAVRGPAAVRAQPAFAQPALALPGVVSVAGQTGLAVASGSAVSEPATDLRVGPAVGRAAALAFPTAAAPPTPAQIQAQIDATVRSVFNAAENWLYNHQGGPLVSFLEGALLLVRRSLFNQAPTIVATQPTTGQDGTITGQVNAIDHEGDQLTFTVVEAPGNGEFQIDEGGHWRFTPSGEYDGNESFIVKITPQARSLNLTNLGDNGSRTVTINVGGDTTLDAPELMALLPAVSGRLTVTKNFLNQYRASVALSDVTAQALVRYFDSAGRFGAVTMEDLEAYLWDDFRVKAADNGATVNLTLTYTAAGKPNAVLLGNVELGKDTAGQYRLYGSLSPEPQFDPNGPDYYNVVGNEVKLASDTFRASHNIDSPSNFTTVAVDFTGDISFDTFTALSYRKSGMWHDTSEATKGAETASIPGNPATGEQAGGPPGETIPGAEPTLDATANAAKVTSSVSNGGAVYIGRSDGTVETWVQGEKTYLNNPDLITTVSTAKVTTTLWRGDTLIVGRDSDGRVEAWNGNELKVLSPKPGPNADTNWNSSVTTLLEYDNPVTDGLGNTVYSTGFVVGLGNGSVQLWSDTAQSWIQLHDKVWDSAVNSMISFGDGFVVGLANGSVHQFNASRIISGYMTQAQSFPVAQAGWAPPVNFTGSISGTTLTAQDPTGAIQVGTSVVGGPADNTTITQQLTGTTGGAGTYKVTPSQTWPNGGGSGTLTSGKAGNHLFLSLPSGVDPRSLVGSTVTGTNVAAGTKITGYSGPIANVQTATYEYSVNTYNLVGPGPLTISQALSPDTSTWKNNWKELHNDGWQSGVTAMMPFKGRPDLCSGGCPGFLVGLANGSVQQYNEAKDGLGKPGWYELQGSGWKSAVKGIVLSRYDGAGLPTFAVGLENGAVEQWLGYGWAEIEKPGKGGFNSDITAMAQYGENFIVGLKNGAVLERVNPSNAASYWVSLHDDGWKSQVNQIVPVKPEGGSGVYVGLDNGSVLKWSGQTAGTNPDSGQNYWTQLHDSVWRGQDSTVGVTTITRTGLNGGITISLVKSGNLESSATGTLQQWTPQSGWLQLTYTDPIFGSGVTQVLPYNLPLTDKDGRTVESNFSGYIVDNKLTVTSVAYGSTVVVGSEITGVDELTGVSIAPGTRITQLLEANTSGGFPGIYEVSIPQRVGSLAPQPYLDDPEVDKPPGIRISQMGVPAVAPGVVVSLADGSIRLLSSGSSEWITLQKSWAAAIGGLGDAGAVTVVMAYQEGLLVGLTRKGSGSGAGPGNGYVYQWTGPGVDPDPATWEDNWIERGRFYDSGGVTVMTPYRDGFLVGLANGSVQQYTEAGGGWDELHGSGWQSAVKGIVLSKTDSAGLPLFAVGLQNGSVQQWNGKGNGFVEIQRPGKETWWDSAISSMAQFGQNFIVGLENGMVQMRINPGEGNPYNDWIPSTGDQWVALKSSDGWRAAVNQIVAFQSNLVPSGLPWTGSSDITTGVVVGLSNGSVQMWNGGLRKNDSGNVTFGDLNWTELHDSGWNSSIETLVVTPADGTNATGEAGPQDGVVVGLANGAAFQWNGMVTGATGQNDWATLNDFSNFADESIAFKEPLSCSASTWRCTQKGQLSSAVTFGTLLANGFFEMPAWGSEGGIGGPNDPIFSNPNLQSGSEVYGKYYTIAFTTSLTAGGLFGIPKLEYYLGLENTYKNQAQVGVSGSIAPMTFWQERGILSDKTCDGAQTQCTVMILSAVKDSPTSAPQNPVVATNNTLMKPFFVVGAPVGGSGVVADTTIVKYLGTTAGDSCLGGECTAYQVSNYQYVSGPGAKDPYLPNLKLTAAPSVRIGVDVIPVMYGYVYVPDAPRDMLKSGSFSAGMMLAMKMGPSITANIGPGGQMYGPPKDYPIASVSVPGFFEIDSIVATVGVQFSGGAVLNGLEKPRPKIYAYVVPGMVAAFNTAGQPGGWQFGTNHYIDASMGDLKAISGISVTGSMTPYIDFAYGIMVPPDKKIIGGKSVFKLSAGYDNPISLTGCADWGAYCTKTGVNQQASFYGFVNDGTSEPWVFGGRVANPTVGNVLTVTQSALLGAQPKVGQLLTGPGLIPGTTITRYLGTNEGYEQWEIGLCDVKAGACSPTLQSSIGQRYPGTFPAMTASTPGSYGSFTLGSQGNLRFHAGLMEWLPYVSKWLKYDAKVPLYDINATYSLRDF